MRSSGLRDTGSMLLGAGIGAGLMFMLDPHAGRRRRALIKDQIVSLIRNARLEANRQRHDLMNRTRGQVMEWWRRAEEGPADDDILEQRVRAQVGHMVSHLGSLEFHARRGVVIVSGTVLQGEKQRIEEQLRKTRGVKSWDLSAIEEHASSASIPGFQAEARRRRFGA